MRLAFVAVALTLGGGFAVWWVFRALRQVRQSKHLQTLATLVEYDALPCVMTDLDRRITSLNRAARAQGHQGQTLTDLLGAHIADASAMIHRVQSAVLVDGIATETAILPNRRVSVSAHMAGAGALLWRIEVAQTAEGANPSERAAYPSLTIGRGGTVLWMNPAARDLAGGRVRTVEDLITDPPLRPDHVHRLSGGDGKAGAEFGRDYIARVQPAGMGRQEVVFVPKSAAAPEAAPNTVPVLTEMCFESLPVPLLKVTPDGLITEANRTARELFHTRIDGDISLPDLMEGLGRPIIDWLSDAARGQGLGQSEFLRLTHPERDIFVQVTLKRVVENDQVVLVAVLNDATELKSLEAQFVQSQKMQAIGQLAGGVAHDFNNLLTAISGHCDLLLLRHDPGDPEYGDLVQIHQNANRAAALVGQLLAFSRKQTLRPQRLELRDILSDLTHLLNRLVGEKIVLNLRQNPQLPPIRADKRQLEQVIMNLVVNARDAMARGGTILIETDHRVLDTPLTQGRARVPPGSYVVVRVEDEGTGIAADNLEKVFEPFYTTKRTGEGTGLGLSTVYGIVKQTGGFVFVDSTPGKGSVFTLLFPVCDDPVAQPAPQPERTRPVSERVGDGVVLLVEDEAPVRAFASRALAHRGFRVIEASTAEEALELLKDNDLTVDVFVTDVVMPGLDGPSWVRQARKMRPDVPVIFMSGYAEDVFKSEGARIEDSAFLAKPFSLTELTTIVNQQLVADPQQAQIGPIQ